MMTFPKNDGFFMPSEFSAHRATIVIFPERGGSWIYGAKFAMPVFAEIIKNIATGEKVFVAVTNSEEKAKALLADEISKNSVEILKIPTDDSWARDVAPTFVTDGKGDVRGVDWVFNAWGGDFDGLYESWARDDAFAAKFCEKTKFQCYSARPFVLEGGSIHSNGDGLILTTEECLLSKGRNPEMTKDEIEKKLKLYLGGNKVVWLPYGVVGDETNGHVDNICAFTSRDTVVLGWSEEGEQGRRCLEDLKVLENAGLNVIKLPFPKKPVEINQFEADGFVYSDGEARRTVGERLAASYVNFYVANSCVLVPQFGDENDGVAIEILQKAFNRKVVPIFARDIIVGGGNIHCITQQIPR